jgi:hypothetical protein
LSGERIGQHRFAVDGRARRRITGLDRNFFDAEAYRVDVDAGRLEPNHDFVHQQR